MASLSVTRAIELIKSCQRPCEQPILVFWYRTEASRHAVAGDLHSGAPRGVCSVLVEDREFTNANAVPNDLIASLERHREAVEDAEARAAADGEPLIVVLLSRTSLTIPQTSSPVLLPPWLGRLANAQWECSIEDLEQSPLGPLDSQDLQVASICALVFELERAIQVRLATVAADSHAPLALRLLTEKERKTAGADAAAAWTLILGGAKAALGNVKTGERLRLSAAAPSLVCERIIRAVGDTTPVSLQGLGRELTEALRLGEEVHWPLLTLLCRSTIPDKPPHAGRILASALFAAYHCANSVAHADRFPNYSNSLQTSVSADLIRGLGSYLLELNTPELVPAGEN